jgi:hypothetical protein
MPPGFLTADAPALLALKREHRRFDLTTDLALSDPAAPPLGRYSGVLYTSAPLWTPRATARLLRSYVRVGGRVAWLGPDGFLRTAGATRAYLFRPSRRRAANLFGEPVREAPGGVVSVLDDGIGFFAGVGSVVGTYGRLEEGLRPPPGGRTLAAAGTQADRPALTVYRVPGGVVARVGASGFAASLPSSPGAGPIMRRLWTLLSR